MKGTFQYDLPLGDISGKIRDRMCDIVIRHCQDWNLCDGTGCTVYDPGSLIKCCKLTVQISRIAFPAWDLSLLRRNFTHRLCKRSHIGQYYKDMHIFLKREILGGCQRHLRRDQTLCNRIIGEI